METDAQKRAEAAFAKKAQRASDASLAWTEHKEREAAIDANTERLKALRLARHAEAAAPLASVKKSKPKVRRGR